VRYRLQRAHETLEESSLLREKGHLNAAVNRLYHSCFYAVSALLLAEGKSSSKHSGVRAFFNKEWVKTGRISSECGRVYRRLYDSRQKGGYGDFVRFVEAEVAPWFQEAQEFVTTVATLAEGIIQEEGDNSSLQDASHLSPALRRAVSWRSSSAGSL
jgi:uncharacterized protein (UPF0332 family)